MSEISIRCLLEFGTSNEVRFNLPTPPVVLSLVGSFHPSFPNPSAFVFFKENISDANQSLSYKSCKFQSELPNQHSRGCAGEWEGEFAKV